MKTMDILLEAKRRLRDSGVDEREARLLLSFALGVKSDDLIKYDEIDENAYNTFWDALNKRCNHIPYAYIVGHKEFMKIDFIVNESVLIPRADTEILVEETIKICRKFGNEQTSILDICTGSGCIAVSLAKYIENAKVDASDISEDALKVAKINASNNDVNVDFIKSNLFDSINQKYDVIVSNPPYIKREVIDTLEKEVKDNEPLIALNGGKDGLDFYRRISKDAKEHLNKDGYVIFEIGYDQASEVLEILNRDGYKNVRVVKDYSENDRVVIANI